MPRNQRDENEIIHNIVEFKNTDDVSPTISLSGGLFVSGGELYYIGSTGTITYLAAQ